MSSAALIPYDAAAKDARSSMGAHHGLRSETGYVRKANEDRLGFRRTALGEFYIVSDGMGGQRGGALAAQLTVRALMERFGDPGGLSDARERLREAFAAANAVVHDARRPDDPETRAMGATAVAVVLRGRKMIVGHVGDSRAYRWSRAGGLKAMTRDHTHVQRLVDAKLISSTDAAHHPEASVLSRAMGHHAEVEAEVSEWITLAGDDRIVLCSDGLCGYASSSEIAAAMKLETDPQRQADRLIDLALKKGGEDNVTVQVIQVGGMNYSVLNRILGAPLFLLLLMTATYLSTVFWVHSALQSTQEEIAGLAHPVAAPAAVPAPAPAAESAQLAALRTQVEQLDRRLGDRITQLEKLSTAAAGGKAVVDKTASNDAARKGAQANDSPKGKTGKSGKSGKSAKPGKADDGGGAKKNDGTGTDATAATTPAPKGDAKGASDPAKDGSSSGAGDGAKSVDPSTAGDHRSQGAASPTATATGVTP